MNRRTTFALDEETIQRLKKLAALHHISQAEVVRRAVEKAELEFISERKDLLSKLEAYHAKGGLKKVQAEAYLEEVAENRSVWERKY